MRVVIEELATKNISSTALEQIRAALESESFSDACCIGALAGTTVYLRCPNAPHGVIVDTQHLDEYYINWIVNALAGSVRAGRA
jgi:hypothetical protein